MKRDRNTSKGPSQRQLRVGEQLRHIIAEALSRGIFHDERLIDAHITVAEVRVTPDLKLAKAYVMSLGGADMDTILPALNDGAYAVQKEISRQSSLKFTPKVRFVRDESFDEAQRIDELLRGIHIPDDDNDGAAED